MELVLIVIATFLAGALLGFGIATIYSSNQILTLWDEKKRLNRELIEAQAEKQSLEEIVEGKKVQYINISDPTVGKEVDYSKTW